jgi:hypothetical protein
MAITVCAGSAADRGAATAGVSKGTDLARFDIRGWALDATDPDIRIEIRRLTYNGQSSLRFRFQAASDPKSAWSG